MAAPPPYPPYDPTPFNNVLSIFTAALDKVDTHTTARLNRMEIAMANMAKVATEALQVATSARQETKDGLERLHTGVVNAAKCSLASSEKIEMILGNVNGDPDVDPEHESTTVLGRIRQLERAVVELSESVSDPDAARPVIVRHEASVNTDPVVRALVDAGVDALELEPLLRHADTGTQAATAQAATEFDPSAGQPAGAPISRAQLGAHSEGSTAVQTPAPPFALQPLAPAHWSSAGRYSDEFSSSANSKVPSPDTDQNTQHVPKAHAAPLAIVPSTSTEGRASSIFEEQEILQSLGADGAPDSRMSSSPPPIAAPQTPPTPPPPRAIPPIPRRSAAAQASAASGSSGPVASASPPHTTNAAPSPSQPPSQPPPNASPPIPRRKVAAVVAAAASSITSSNQMLTNMAAIATMTAPPAPPPSRPTVLPIPRGFGKRKATSSGSASTSSLSSASQPPQPPRTPAAPSTPGSLSSGSLSSLSSLSSPPKSQVGTQSSARSPGRAQSASRDDSASVSARAAGSSARGRSRRAARGAKAGGSASARVTVKKERSEGREAGPPAKRRKTMGSVRSSHVDDGDDDDESVSTSGRGGRSASRGRGGGRGRGRGRGGASSTSASARKAAAAASTSGGQPASSKGGDTQPKRRQEPPAVGTDCRWPPKIDGDEAYQREFVQCDNCEAWYHFGCVGLETGDPRLEPDAEFFCPPCETSDAIRTLRQSLRFEEAACMRPDCARAGLAEDTNEYFVERIIGRRPYEADLAAGIKPVRFLWLVKWDGWKAESASWQERTHLGDCARFIEEFEQAAEIEGRKVDRLDKVIVLNEGLAAGW